MKVPESVTAFRDLIRWLAAERHGGNYYRMAMMLDVSPALTYMWRDGTVRRASDANLAKIAATYELDYRDVQEVAYGLRRPFVTPVRSLLVVLGLAALLGTVPRDATGGVLLPNGTHYQNSRSVNLPLIGRWRRFRAWWRGVARGRDNGLCQPGFFAAFRLAPVR